MLLIRMPGRRQGIATKFPPRKALCKASGCRAVSLDSAFWSSGQARKQNGSVKQEQQCGHGCQQLVVPLSPCDRGQDHRKAEDHMKLQVHGTGKMSRENKILGYTKNEARQQGTEKPASMRKIVVPQIDEDTPGDVRQN